MLKPQKQQWRSVWSQEVQWSPGIQWSLAHTYRDWHWTSSLHRTGYSLVHLLEVCELLKLTKWSVKNNQLKKMSFFPWPVVLEISPSAQGMQSKQQTGSPCRIPILVPGWHRSLHTDRGVCNTNSTVEKQHFFFVSFSSIRFPHAITTNYFTKYKHDHIFIKYKLN